MTQIDAVLLLSFGGPERPQDVMPFLERVTAGRGIPPQRLAKVAEQYLAFGGISPINEQNRELVTALREALAASGLDLPVYWGNRNWDPLLAHTLRQMRGDGVQCAAVIVTSGYSSYSGCRQYRENLYDAVQEVQSDGQGSAPQLLKVRRWFDQPAFIEAMVDNTVAAVERIRGAGASLPQLVFTTHSIPISQALTSGDPLLGGNMYERQHRFAAEQIAGGVSVRLGRELPWELVYQSRSGPPTVPWLEPDVGDYLVELKEQAAQGAVMIPIGFASDHMEVMWDLDTQAMQQAQEVGLPCVRAATVGTDPRFVHALVDLVAERVRQTPTAERIALGPWGAAPDVCPVGCCPNNKGERPALCGTDSPGE